MKDATVAVGFMAWLKLKTTGAVGETPLAMFAGTVETTAGCACDNPSLASKTASARSPTRGWHPGERSAALMTPLYGFIQFEVKLVLAAK